MNMIGNAPNKMRGRGRNQSRVKVKVVPIQKQVMGPPTRPVLKRKQISDSGTSSSYINWNNNQQSTANLSDSIRTTTTTRSYSTSELESRVILAITEGRGEAVGEVGIAAINITKPSLILCQISDSQSYINTLTKINILNPTEILVPLTFVESASCNRLMEKLKEQFRDITITGISRSSFNNRVGMEYVKQLCVPSMNSIFLILQHRYYALSAAAALLRYTETTFFIFYAKESIKIVYQESEESTIIDVATADRLELVASARPTMKKRYSCLLDVLNHCHTKIGTRTLRANILQPPCSVSEIEGRLNCITELMDNTEMLTAIREILLKAKNVDQLLTLATILPDHAQSCSERQLNYLLTLNTVLQQIEPLKHVLQNTQQPFFVEIFNLLSNVEFLEVKSLVQNIIHDDAHSAKGQSGVIQRCFAIKSGLNPILDLVRKSYSERLDEMREYVKGLSEKYGLSLVLHNNNKKGYHIVLNLNGHQKRIFKRKDIPGEFIQVEHLTSSYTMKTPQLINMSHRVEDIMTEILTMSNIMIHKLLIKIRKHVAIFYNLCEAVAKLDMLQSLANASNNIHYVRPNFGDYLEVVQARHPLLNFLCSKEPVANSIYASRDYNMHIITGPNGSGKSIFIRQIVLIQVMAQVGCYIPAESATLKLCDRILARVYLEDNIHCDASAFVLEMKEINYFLNVLTSKTLIIIDELCRSTSVEEGTALAMAICERLLKTDAIMFFTTHYKFLTKLEDLYFNVKTWQLETLTETKNNEMVLQFTYNVIPGVVSLEHYGIFLAKATWPESIIKYVYNVIDDLSKSQTNNRSLHFKKVSQAARLKYDLEAEARSLKEKGQLTRLKLNEKLLDYKKKLAEVGHLLDVPLFDLQENNYNFEQNNLVQMDTYANKIQNVDSFEANVTNDSSFTINDQYGLVQMEVSAEVHNVDTDSIPFYKKQTFDHARTNLFQSLPKFQVDQIVTNNESCLIPISEDLNESQFHLFEPQVILTTYETKENDSSNSHELKANEGDDLTFEISQSQHSIASNDEIAKRFSFFSRNTIPAEQYLKANESIRLSFEYPNPNASFLNDQVGSSQESIVLNDSLNLSRNEAFINKSLEISLLSEDDVIGNDLNSSSLCIRESQFRMVLNEANFRTSTPIPQTDSVTDIKNMSNIRTHSSSLLNSFETIQMLPPEQLNSWTNSNGIKWKESENLLSKSQKSCSTDLSYHSLSSLKEETVTKLSSNYPNNTNFKFKPLGQQNLNRSTNEISKVQQLTSKSGLNTPMQQIQKHEDNNQFESNCTSSKIIWAEKEKSTDSLTDTSNKSSRSQLQSSNSNKQLKINSDERAEQFIRINSSSSSIDQAKKIANFMSSSTSNSDNIKWLDNAQALTSRSLPICSLDEVLPFIKSGFVNNSSLLKNKETVVKEQEISNEICEVLEDLDNCSEYFSGEDWDDEAVASQIQQKSKEDSSINSKTLDDVSNAKTREKIQNSDTNKSREVNKNEKSQTNIFGEDSSQSQEMDESFTTLAEQISDFEANFEQQIRAGQSKEMENAFTTTGSRLSSRKSLLMQLEEKENNFESCSKNYNFVHANKTPTEELGIAYHENVLSPILPITRLPQNLNNNSSNVQTKGTVESKNTCLEPLGEIHLELFSDASISEDSFSQISDNTNDNFVNNKSSHSLPNKSTKKRKRNETERFKNKSITSSYETVPNSTCKNSSNSSKKTKWLPPFKATSTLTRKEIEKIYHEQNKRALESGDLQLIVNRPSVRQLQQVEHIVSAHKTSSGVVVVPAPKKKVKTKQKFKIPLKQSSSDFDVRIFSDQNSTIYEQSANFLSAQNTFSITSSPIISKKMVINNPQSSCGFYTQNRQEMDSIVNKYLNLNQTDDCDDIKIQSQTENTNFDDSFHSSSSSMFKLN